MFHKPQFQRPDQALILNLRLAEEYPEAYTSRNLTSLVKIERSLSDEVILGVGVGDRMSRVEQLGRIERFNLLSLPLNLDWNTRNDLLNPIQGGYLNAQIEPYYDTYGSDLRFTKGLLSYQRYFHVSSNPNFILAMRGSIGAMEGAERDDIPADIRFYAGGGGSIRGYPYQSVGPIQDGIPIGGRSLFGLSTELRTKISEPFGLVFFIDGGNAFETAMPDVDQSLYWGTGIGLRYFTAIGPLRMDVGFPLTRRESMDDSFQIYVSIGQAF
jgi:translocation and assembly module TamA